VDGTPGVRQELVRRLAQVPGLSVVGDTGECGDAMRMLESWRPDVLLIDHRRMACEATELVRRMAAAESGVSIVVLTAYFSQQERAALIEAGARAVVAKEIDTATLVWTIRTVAAGAGSRGRRLST
jgi:DNA-binding NarL/FixJ family response regulator